MSPWNLGSMVCVTGLVHWIITPIYIYISHLQVGEPNPLILTIDPSASIPGHPSAPVDMVNIPLFTKFYTSQVGFLPSTIASLNRPTMTMTSSVFPLSGAQSTQAMCDPAGCPGQPSRISRARGTQQWKKAGLAFWGRQ